MKNKLTRHIPRIDIHFSTELPGGYSGLQSAWPLILAAALAGILLDLMIAALREIRRRLYNRNRNLVYAKKNKWRKKRQPRYKIPRPLPPSFKEGLCQQWDKVHDSLDEMLKFGEMMIELDDYVDNSFVFDDKGGIISRFPGIKGFLKEHCPHIPYKTSMRYRILAMKARQVAEGNDGELPKIRKECTTICALTQKFDANLEVKHKRLKHKKRRKHLCRLNPNSASLFLREQARADLRRIHSSQHQDYIASLQETVRRLSAS